MSLIRRFALLMLAVVLLALAGGVATTLVAARDTLQTQLGVKNRDNAQSLALALSQQRGDASLMEVVMLAQFDTGHYRRIVLRGGDSAALFERSADARRPDAPRWFAQALPIHAESGVAQVSDGWRAIGTLELESQSAWAVDALWRAGMRAALLLAGVGALGFVLAAWGLRTIRRPLDAAIAQARSVQEGRFVTVDEPAVTELRPLARSMNTMVERLRGLFDAQAHQVDALRQQAQLDALTGLRNRRQFLLDAQQLLEAAGPEGSGLLLLRLLDLEGLNRRLGHAGADGVLQALASTLSAHASQHPHAVLGRLNGSDLALCVSAPGPMSAVAQALVAALRKALPGGDAAAAVVAGAVEVPIGVPLHQALAQADQALARAEEQGPFAAVSDRCLAKGEVLGEADWQKALVEALREQRVTLAQFAVCDSAGRVIQLDCPLRVKLRADGEFEPASRWLALAARSRLTPAMDERALELVLAEIGRDGRERCVNFAAATLHASDVVVALTARMAAAPEAASRLWVDVPESLAAEHPALVQDLTRRWRALGVRVGLEHAGASLGSMGRLYELGLHYVRIDGRFLAGIARDEALRRHAEQLALLLRGIGLQVFAETVQDRADLAALWTIGFHGATGPAVE
ncbi:MAG: LapD/MoxY N-terminal periplasmic domain-containing protein [Burkholderiaceae bacterium]